jgi:hypothetical protein
MRSDHAADDETGLSHAGRRLLVIVAYYVVIVLALTVTRRYSPSTLEAFGGRSFAQLTVGPSELISKSQVAATASELGQASSWEQGKATLFALAGALLTALPVALVYSLTRRRKGFDQSMVHVLLLLPIAVAGMVVLIQNNLALAFSLAGIVAVLRFRNSLDDVKDGVYVFIAVSIGMSAAVGALAIGFVTSVVFNFWVVFLWWLDFARRPTPGLRGGWKRFARLPKIQPAKPSEEEQMVAAAEESGEEVFASAARAWRRQLQLTAEHAAATPAQGFNVSLRVHSSAPDLTRPAVEEILRVRTRKWELTGVVPDGASFTLKYVARVKRDDRSSLLDALRAAREAVGVELR